MREKKVYLIDNRVLKYPYTKKEIDTMDDESFIREAMAEENVWSITDFVLDYSRGSLPPYDCSFMRILNK
jgi:hypothetical protein